MILGNKNMSQIKTMRWGILGCGKIAHTFARALCEVEKSQLHAVAARDGNRAQTFAAEHGSPIAYGSYESMLADPAVDAVYIATIHPQHFEWIVQSLRAGKHVLCEKPLVMHLREAKLVQKLAQERRCLLREAFMYRHHPQTQKVVELIESGVIGKVRMIEAKFCFKAPYEPESRIYDKALGGGGIMDVGCYALSFARLIAGRALGRHFAEPLELKAVGHFDPQTKVDTWTTALLRFEGDILGQCTAAVAMQTENCAWIYGDKGRIRVADPWICNGEIHIYDDGDREVEIIQARFDRDLHAYEIEAFARELCGHSIGAKEVGMCLEDSLGNMKCLDRWRREIGLTYVADRIPTKH